jgi:molybdate transport system substrate-binding protein
MIKNIIFISLFLNTFLFSKSITIAVSANVSYAIDSLIQEFNKQYPNIKVHTTTSSSGKLTAQIVYGAPFDIFMSANMKYPNTLYDKNLAITKPKVYAKGTLALFSKTKRDFSNYKDILTNTNIKKIAISNFKIAPYGIAGKEFLTNINLYEKLKPKFVYGDSVSQTVSYSVRVCDVGLIATSALYSSKMSMYKQNENWIKLNSKLYNPIKQGIVILKYAKNNKNARLFYDFILSEKAKDIFKQFGYKL